MWSFRRANPDYQLGKPFVYVGMTGLDPDIRFDKHKAGIQANRFVQQWGVRLRPELYERHNPMPYDDARLMEVNLGIVGPPLDTTSTFAPWCLSRTWSSAVVTPARKST
jgi:hypothetical protein